MKSPSLPRITPHEDSTLPESDRPEQKLLMRSNLKRILSKDARTSEEEQLFGEGQNQFVLETAKSKRFVTRTIIPNSALEEPLLLDKPKQLKFSKTQVHEVENWKEFNKPERCCYCCVFQ